MGVRVPEDYRFRDVVLRDYFVKGFRRELDKFCFRRGPQSVW